MREKTTLIIAVTLPLVILVTVLVYWPGLQGPFLLDDNINIVAAYVADFNFDQIYYAVTHNLSGIFGRPVSVFSLVISGILHGPEPWGYKFHNLVIHLLNGLLIFWLLITLLPRLSPDQGKNKTLLVSGLVASIWLLHPLMVSTVLYAVQRMAQLSVMFTVISLLCYLFARESVEDDKRKFYLLAYLAFPLALILALLSKENGALIPLYIFAIEFIAFRFGFGSSGASKRMLCFLGIFVALPILVGGLYVVTHFGQLADYSLRAFTLGERLLTQLHVVAMYLKMILLPRLSDMTLFHDYIDPVSGFDPVTIILFLVLLAAIALIFALRKKAPVLSFAIAWFIVSHLMESTFLSLELMFEHRNYLAAVGPLLALVYYLFEVPGLPQLKYMNALFLILVVVLTMGRVREWQSEELIYEIAILEHPDSARAQTQMANVRFNQGRYQEALEHLIAAQVNAPHDFGPVMHEVVYRCATGADMSPLFEESKRRASLYPATAYSLNSLDNMLILLNRDSCPEVQLDELIEVVQIAKAQPNNQQKERFMGFLDKVEGQANLLKGNYPEGIALMLSAYEKTGMTRVLGNLVKNLIELRLYGDAEVLLQELDKINQENNGAETALISPLRNELQQARQESASQSSQKEH